MFQNSTVSTDIRYSYNQLPLPQIYIEHSVSRMQFVRIENKGFHFVKCANIFNVSGLSFIGLVSAFDLSSWTSLIAISAFSTLV